MIFYIDSFYITISVIKVGFSITVTDKPIAEFGWLAGMVVCQEVESAAHSSPFRKLMWPRHRRTSNRTRSNFLFAQYKIFMM